MPNSLKGILHYRLTHRDNTKTVSQMEIGFPLSLFATGWDPKRKALCEELIRAHEPSDTIKSIRLLSFTLNYVVPVHDA